MKKTKTAAIVMASLMVAGMVSAGNLDFSENEYTFPDGSKMLVPREGNQPQFLPVGTIIHVELTPENRRTLQNYAITTILTLYGIDHGIWDVSGSCTIQYTSATNVRGAYLYAHTAFSVDPNVLPGRGYDSYDARPYSSVNQYGDVNHFWWFGTNPPPRVFVVDNGTPPIYLLAQSYGQVPPALSQAFGTIQAVKVSQ